MVLQKEIEELFERQMTDWHDAGERYAALRQSRRRTCRTVSGVRLQLCYNPARQRSTLADVSDEAIKSRPCFLCEKNKPVGQEVVEWQSTVGNAYRIQVNPFPITEHHFTIVSSRHEPQLIASRFTDMAELARQLPDYAILYNGPCCGATAPDHFHFQAVPKVLLPIVQHYWDDNMDVRMINKNERFALVSNFDLWCTNLSIIAKTCSSIDDLSRKILGSFPVIEGEQEPRFNIVAWQLREDGSKVSITILPRRCHRPQNFGTGRGKYLVSPGVLDMTGVVTFINESDFMRPDWATVNSLLRDVSMDNYSFEQILENIKQLKI